MQGTVTDDHHFVAARPSVERIKRAVAEIDHDRSHSVDTIDAYLIYEIAFDGGGEVTFHFRGEELVKVRQILGLSWGRVSDEYYFQDDTLMFHRECEELFPITTDGSGLDHSRLVTSFVGTHYVWTWQQ